MISNLTKSLLGKTRFAQGKPLSAREIEERRPEYIETIMDWAEALDQLITYTTGDAEEAYIWRTLSRDEAEMLADWLLERARTHPQTAGVVRGMMATRKHARIVLLVGTRVKMTGDHYREHGFGIPSTRRKRRS